MTSPPTSKTSEHQQQQYRRHPQGLPSISSLTNGLPLSSQQHSPDQRSAVDSTRDSGSWQMQSKHTSANSGLQVSTLLNPDDSPPRNSMPNTPLSARMPNSAHAGSEALPSINQGFHEASNRDSHASIDSRRSSVDSRMHSGFNGLYINNPTSPYESANGSQVSLAASLRRPNGQAPISPMSGRSSIRSHPPPRVAPPIMPLNRTPGHPDPTAAKPTQGYAWAFPDTVPEERRDSESGESSIGHGVSRNNSFAASSVRSSIFSTDSHLPTGQNRFDDGE
ncbi:hypothetical protein LTR37_008448 [Vermiconidia calcicola]|uniref:Uncharacterized protein n=1 Tax=Vermiconidia calcicola TaxID=1690605 RepID=A0ACC3NCA1_9PEZI|nr:hypothetical protein LTR37_008448 [Vermiconidia calcicola]